MKHCYRDDGGWILVLAVLLVLDGRDLSWFISGSCMQCNATTYHQRKKDVKLPIFISPIRFYSIPELAEYPPRGGHEVYC